MYRLPVFPNYIVVHLGGPKENARNIRVRFIEYIKNVASGELYPNWPEEALRANIYAIISFALNRIYNEWYRAQGYNFDITSSSAYDQSFVEDRQFFERIYVIVDEIFNSYIVRDGQVQPLFAQYCDGKKSTCSGLSQWGSVTLANQGLSAIEILKKYYGNNISIVENAELSNDIESFPGFTISLGDAGDFVRLLKLQINRIGQNYPAIPAVITDTIYYDVNLEKAILKFQDVFSLTVTGSVDRATWYKIKYLYNAVKKISNLYSEGISLKEVELKFPKVLQMGNQGEYIRDLHYYLNVISCFDDELPNIELNGDIYSEETYENVLAFQEEYNLEVTGIVDTKTWKKIKEVYAITLKNIPKKYVRYINEFYSGRYLSLGMSGEDVLNLQKMLFIICKRDNEIPGVVVSSEYDLLTEESVKFLQNKFSLNATGVVTAVTWYEIVEFAKR